MARKLRIQPENVCFHVVTRIAHREFFFDETERDIIVRLIRNVEAFSGVQVIAYCIMSNHLHLLLFIDKPSSLQMWERWQMLLHYDFEKTEDGHLYKVSNLIELSQDEVDEVHRCEKMTVLDRYEITKETLVDRIKVLMRPRAFDELMLKWQKMSAAELECEYDRFCVRMYDLSEFMKMLKQDISQYYNLRHKHTGGLWEGRFKDTFVERSVDAMSSVATYIDMNPVRAKICQYPSEYKWNSYSAALEGDEARRMGYNFIYDTSSGWEIVREVHEQQLAHRMSVDTAEAAEKEEAVFTSGGMVGSESFVKRIVAIEDEAFPTGHKTPPVEFKVGGVALRVLRNLSILRKR